uniref:Uncharacterized protein n=1 Tax=Globisporangium ultimum (strain ATCC 200006 / CBS 805.95 / DAOM BR144) TaxID=431595 RepID=K3WN83_GLOUD
MNYTHAQLPERVQTRLNQFGLIFDELSGYLQRAVIWDSGFAIDLFDNFVATKTSANRTMAEISIAKSDVDATGCTATPCVQPNVFVFYHTEICTGNQMLSVVKCVLAEFKLKGNKVSMWASGGDYTGAPAMHAVGHVWTDPKSGVNNSVRAIHTQDIEQTASWSECLKDAYGTMVIPCYPQGMEPTSTDITWADPPFGNLVTQWLTENSMLKAQQQKPQSTGNEETSNTSSTTLTVAVSSYCYSLFP